jgi:hypothetical protein
VWQPGRYLNSRDPWNEELSTVFLPHILVIKPMWAVLMIIMLVVFLAHCEVSGVSLKYLSSSGGGGNQGLNLAGFHMIPCNLNFIISVIPQ